MKQPATYSAFQKDNQHLMVRAWRFSTLLKRMCESSPGTEFYVYRRNPTGGATKIGTAKRGVCRAMFFKGKMR